MVNIFKENGVHFLPNEQKKASKEVENLLSIEFEGKNAVLLFYKSFDGGVFPDGAFLYRDSFFNVKKNDYNMLDIGCFSVFLSWRFSLALSRSQKAVEIKKHVYFHLRTILVEISTV